jgi:hypothetical protein
VSAESNKGASWVTSAIVAAIACALLAFALVTVQKHNAPDPVAPDLAAALRDKGFATTHTRTPRAPRDPHPTNATTGLVVRPNRVIGVYDKPDGKPFAKVAPNEFGANWLPAIARTEGWVQVLLPSKPNGATGWLRSGLVEQGRTAYVVRVHLGLKQMEIYRERQLVGAWKVAIGKESTPTPTGRTFIHGQFSDTEQTFSPVIIPLGTHSATLDNYGGGPGTVAFHGWPKPEVFGHAVSHGCIRVPSDALFQLRQIPAGSIVLIDNQ